MRHLRTRLLLVLALAAGALVAPLPTTAPTAQAADLSLFDPGLIISDAVFYDSTTMSADAVQTFLDSKGSGCSPASGSTCLKDFRMTTSTREATARCAQYTGASNERASDIIAKVAIACGINPQVLIVTLQKEQSLVTATTGKSAAVYQKAMGFGCPDTAACDSLYYGFFNQVYSAASQFQRYAQNPTGYGHIAGRWNAVKYHPTASCGSSQVYIQNQATASLYNYTPYQPNAAALAASTGDSCSSYGNRNFWSFFTDWFGPTNQRPPFGSIDTVSASGTTLTVAGWALDPDTTASIRTHIYIDGVGAASIAADGSRPDVGAIHGKGDLHGYYWTGTVAAGTHEVCVYAIDSSGGANTQLGCRTVTVVNNAPLGSIDTVSASGTTLTVAGWALDPDTTASIRTHIYVDGVGTASIAADGSRPDVGAIHGKGDLHGYNWTGTVTAGTHQVCIYAIDSTGGPNTQLGCRTVTATAPTTPTTPNNAPFGSIDTVSASGTTLTVAGWALDPDTTASIRTHIYVDGVGTASIAANGSRPDVGAIHGKGDLHGYNWTGTVTAGTHQVCIYAIDSTGGPNTQLGCRTVTATAPAAPTTPNNAPFGSIDTVSLAGTTLTVAGWALDPDTTASIRTHIYVDGVGTASIAADGSRPDVGAIHGKGDLHGYNWIGTVTAGTHEVCIYAIDSAGGANTQLGCRTVSS